MRKVKKIRSTGFGTTTDTRTEHIDPRCAELPCPRGALALRNAPSVPQASASLFIASAGAVRSHLRRGFRNTGWEHDEFATRKYLYPGRRVVGTSDLAVQYSERDGWGIDHGDGRHVVPGDLGGNDDRDDVSHGCPKILVFVSRYFGHP